MKGGLYKFFNSKEFDERRIMKENLIRCVDTKSKEKLNESK